MTNKQLLDRQVELVNYLTSSAAIFGDETHTPLDPGLQGIDRGLLRLEALLSYRKRIEKITAVLPRTFELLGSEKIPILAEFVDACPPADVNHLANARQFHDFLVRRWQRTPGPPRHLPDVAACELACATVRIGIAARDGNAEGPSKDGPRFGIRRHPDVILLRCAYDVRPIFEESSIKGAPDERDTPIAVSMSGAARHPRVCEVTRAVFDLLIALDDWVDPAAFGTSPDADALVRELADHGLLQVQN
jgi:hypothetical protein